VKSPGMLLWPDGASGKHKMIPRLGSSPEQPFPRAPLVALCVSVQESTLIRLLTSENFGPMGITRMVCSECLTSTSAS